MLSDLAMGLQENTRKHKENTAARSGWFPEVRP